MTWFADWFNTPYYYILYKDRDFLEAENFIRNLTENLQLPQNAKIIDLACGKGRHSVFLSKLGYLILGVDLSEESILHNKNWESETLKFKVHDMRNELYPKISEKVDAVFNLFTSFGYFDEEDDDRKVFASVKNALKNDGTFILDFLNEQFVKNNLVEKENVEKEGINFEIRKKITENYITKDIFFEDNGKKFHYFEKVKLHTLEDIKSLAQEVGFEVIRVWGNYNLEEFERETSPRCIFQFKVQG